MTRKPEDKKEEKEDDDDEKIVVPVALAISLPPSDESATTGTITTNAESPSYSANNSTI